MVVSSNEYEDDILDGLNDLEDDDDKVSKGTRDISRYED